MVGASEQGVPMVVAQIHRGIGRDVEETPEAILDQANRWLEESRHETAGENIAKPSRAV